MKKLLLVVTLVAVTPFIGFGQNVGSQSFGRTEQEVLATVREFVNATGKRDVATLERVLADGYVDADTALGTTKSRRQFIDECKMVSEMYGAAANFEPLKIQNPVITVHDKIAVLTNDEITKSRVAEQSYSSQILTTFVLAKQNGQWKIVATHGRNLKIEKE